MLSVRAGIAVQIEVGAVRQILDRTRATRGLPPAVVPRFASHRRVADVVVHRKPSTNGV